MAAPTVIAPPASTEMVARFLIWTPTPFATASIAPDFTSYGAREDIEELGRRRGRQGVGKRDGPTGEAGGVDVDVLEDEVAGQQRDVGDGHGDGQVEGVAGQVALFSRLPPARVRPSQEKLVPVATRWPAGLTRIEPVTPPPPLTKAVPVAVSAAGDRDPSGDAVVGVLVHHRGGADGHRRPGVDRDRHSVVDLDVDVAETVSVAPDLISKGPEKM